MMYGRMMAYRIQWPVVPYYHRTGVKRIVRVVHGTPVRVGVEAAQGVAHSKPGTSLSRHGSAQILTLVVGEMHAEGAFV